MAIEIKLIGFVDDQPARFNGKNQGVIVFPIFRGSGNDHHLGAGLIRPAVFRRK